MSERGGGRRTASGYGGRGGGRFGGRAGGDYGGRAGGYGGRDGGNAGRVGGDYGGRSSGYRGGRDGGNAGRGGGEYGGRSGSGYRGGRDGGNAGRGGGDYGGRSGSGYRGGRGGGDYGGRSGGGYEGRRGGGRGGQAWTPPADLRTMRDDDWENARQSLEANLKSLKLSPSKNAEPRFPTRPGPGTLGLPSRIKTNHFHVEYSFLGDLHHYHVTIDPTIPSKKLNKDLMIALVNTNNNDFGNLTPAYDGSKGLYTAGKLQFESKEFDVKLVDDRSVRERSFKVTIKYANLVDHGLLQELLAGTQSESPQEIIQCFDVVLRSAQELKDYVRVGRSLFSRQGDGYLAEGMDYSKGFYQSLRFTQMGLSLNIDTSARIFYRAGGIIDFIEHNFGRGALSQENITKASKALKGVTIIFTHREPRKQYKILGLSTQSSNHLMFTLPDGTQESVSGYFEKKYKRKLEYPYLPCLEVGSRKHPICLPMEVCEIVEGQKYVKKLSHSLVAELLKKTAVPPSTRAADIVWRVQQNDYNEDDLVKQFGFSVNNEFTSVDARVLPPPKILYDGPIPAATVDPSVGQWSMSNQRFHEGATLKFWSFISFSSIVVDRAMTEFRNKLLFELRRKGMVVENPLIERWVLHNDVKRALQDILSESLKEIYNLSRERRQLQLLVIILPDPPGYYGTIKRICEAELGIVSQCLQAEKALTAKRPYMENIALKINVKTGGRNSVLLDAYNEKIPLVTEERTIIFGADVTHPEPGVDSGPSVAAVVASMDWPYIAKYKALVSAQPHRKESIHGLSTMVKELLVSFQQSNGGDLPRKIIFYRDGVSEGEFSNVLLHEVTAIRSAYESLGKTYRPSVTFIVVQKRHHTRLFSDDPQQVDSSSNVLPGTVVDSKICHPSQYDFYLCSHAGIKGTVKPAHYHVLYDENSFTPDLLQLFTNSLCYTYARCTRSVSIVPPVYYAHLAAFRARFYVQQGEGDEVVQPLPEISENVKNVMYFC